MSFYEELNNFEKSLEEFSQINSNAFNNHDIINKIESNFSDFVILILNFKREIQLKDVDLVRDLKKLEELITSFEGANNFEKVILIGNLLLEVRRLKVLLL